MKHVILTYCNTGIRGLVSFPNSPVEVEDLHRSMPCRAEYVLTLQMRQGEMLIAVKLLLQRRLHRQWATSRSILYLSRYLSSPGI